MLLVASTGLIAIAQDTDANRPYIEFGKERDPRAKGIAPTWAWEEAGKTIVRADRNPDGSLRRCVRTARYKITDENGLQAFEIGIERHAVRGGAAATMYARLRYVARQEGPPLAIREPTMKLFFTGPTRDWTVSGPDQNGWVRMSRHMTAENDTEVLDFRNAVEVGPQELVFSLPDGGLKVVEPNGFRDLPRFGIFMRCACEMLRDFPDIFSCG